MAGIISGIQICKKNHGKTNGHIIFKIKIKKMSLAGVVKATASASNFQNKTTIFESRMHIAHFKIFEYLNYPNA